MNYELRDMRYELKKKVESGNGNRKFGLLSCDFCSYRLKIKRK